MTSAVSYDSSCIWRLLATIIDRANSGILQFKSNGSWIVIPIASKTVQYKAMNFWRFKSMHAHTHTQQASSRDVSITRWSFASDRLNDVIKVVTPMTNLTNLDTTTTCWFCCRLCSSTDLCVTSRTCISKVFSSLQLLRLTTFNGCRFRQKKTVIYQQVFMRSFATNLSVFPEDIIFGISSLYEPVLLGRSLQNGDTFRKWGNCPPHSSALFKHSLRTIIYMKLHQSF